MNMKSSQAGAVTEDSIEVSTLQLSATVHSSGKMSERSYDLDCEESFDVTSHGDTTTSLSRKESFVSSIRRRRSAKRVLRTLALIFALLIGFLLCGVIYYFTRLSEVRKFQEDFEELSEGVTLSVAKLVEQQLHVLNALSISFTSSGLASQSQWPTIEIPDFTLRASTALSTTTSTSLLFAPLVRDSSTEAWQEFLFKQEHPSPMSHNATIRDASVEETEEALKIRVLHHVPEAARMTDFDMLTSTTASFPLHELLDHKEIVFSRALQTGLVGNNDPFASYVASLMELEPTAKPNNQVVSSIFFPVFSSLQSSDLVGIISTEIVWEALLQQAHPRNGGKITIVLRNECGQSFTFHLNGDQQGSSWLVGDDHQTMYDGMESVFDVRELANFKGGITKLDEEYCAYSAHVFPSQELEAKSRSRLPMIYTTSAVVVFFFIFCLSLAYERRVSSVGEEADEYHAIVANLFPAAVRDRLVKSRTRQAAQETQRAVAEKKKSENHSSSFRCKAPPKDESLDLTDVFPEAQPIADFFPCATVLFADICGFTAWSSVRSPEQVFTLLQTIFRAFDRVARKRSIFKVETIGDCYMAVTGVPVSQPDHAVRMTKFARECLYRVDPLLEKLEDVLGEGTKGLGMRFGLHSGSVTGGVLQGERARFQLFGDTVNTASRMESTGEKGRIHLSKSTKLLLCDAGMEDLVERRMNPVNAKGKGYLETYWIARRKKRRSGENLTLGGSDSEVTGSDRMQRSLTSLSLQSGITDSSDGSTIPDFIGAEDWSLHKDQCRIPELIDWHVEVLGSYLNTLLWHRKEKVPANNHGPEEVSLSRKNVGSILGEVSEIIPMPPMGQLPSFPPSQLSIELPRNVIPELREYVTNIFHRHRPGHFHNFIRTTKISTFTHNFLLSLTTINERNESVRLIAGDPLMQLSLMFASLVHAVANRGVTNNLLAREDEDLAHKYKYRLISEQLSVAVALEELMDPKYRNLTRCMFPSAHECSRFRQILVNLVISTDLSDKEMRDIRCLRWNEAFLAPINVMVGRKRTIQQISIGIELILQLATVSHTMQSWDIYIRWNERAFMEAHEAFKAGRTSTDPRKAWFAREIFFFDHHCIPIVEKAHQTGLINCANLIQNAKSNRQEWMLSGRHCIHKMIERQLQSKAGSAVGSLLSKMQSDPNNGYHFSLQNDFSRAAM